MSGLSRLAIVVTLFAGVCGVAQAQSHTDRASTAPDSYDALSEGRSVAIPDRTAAEAGTVPPSESSTVMGLRVPR